MRGGGRQPAEVLVFTDITSFPLDFRTSTQHYYESETFLKKNTQVATEPYLT